MQQWQELHNSSGGDIGSQVVLIQQYFEVRTKKERPSGEGVVNIFLSARTSRHNFSVVSHFQF